MSTSCVSREYQKKKKLVMKAAARLQLGLLPYHDPGADRDAIIEIGDVGIHQPEAAGRDRSTDRIRPVGPVDAIHGGPEIHRAYAERITGSAGHEARQIRLALDHFWRRCPVRPFCLSRDIEQSLPRKSVSADTNAVADRAAIALNQIEMAL